MFNENLPKNLETNSLFNFFQIHCRVWNNIKEPELEMKIYYWAYAMHAGYQILQTNTHNIEHILLFNINNRKAKEIQLYVYKHTSFTFMALIEIWTKTLLPFDHVSNW
jgi:hypothetical protein